MKTKEIKLTIPTDVMDITLGQYQEYLHLIEGLDKGQSFSEFTRIKIVSIFCNVPYELVRIGFKASLIDDISSKVKILIDTIISNVTKKEFEPTFSIGETKFGFITDFEDMMAGEFADLSTYINEWDTMHKAMCVLYRPIKKEKYNPILKVTQYKIDKYNGSEKYSEMMKQMPAMKAIEASFFLSNSFLKLRQCFLLYMANKGSLDPKLISQLKDSLVKSGDGMNHFIR